MATFTIGWAWGTHTQLAFDPSRDILDFGWVLGEYFTVTEQAGSVVISLPSNQHSYTLTGVGLDEMTMANVTAHDASSLAVWQAAFNALPPVGGHAETAVAIGWNYGVHATIAFDPAHQFLDFGWMLGSYFTVSEKNGSVVIDIPSNKQSFTLSGVSLDEMTIADIKANDASTLAVWQAAFDAADEPENPPAQTIVTIGWNYGVHATIAFDPAHQTLDFGWMLGSYFTVSEKNGSVVIDIPSNMQSFTLSGVGLDDMTIADIKANDPSTLAVWQAAFDAMDDPDEPPHSEHIFTITLAHGSNTTLTFDPTHQLLDFGTIAGSDFTVSEVSGSVVIAIAAYHQTITLTGVGLDDMSMANIMGTDPTALSVWATALGDDGGGQETQPGGGNLYPVVTTGADIEGFDPMTDRLDLGQNSVHAFIVVDTPHGMGFMNPWTDAVQMIPGVRLADLDIGNFAPVWNNHLREDLSGALAWEHGITAAPNTVYARSHEIGWVDRVAFDPDTDVVDFRYYGTRELLRMFDSEEGVVIDNGATGQKLILLDTTVDELSPENFLFHYAQVYEDHLDQQLGFDFDPDNVVSRATIPDAGSAEEPLGHHQHEHGHEHLDAVITEIAWAWGTNTTLEFDPHEDRLDFGGFTPDQFSVAEVGDDVVISIVGHQQTYVLNDTDLDDLSIGDIIARNTSTMLAWVDYLA